MRYGGHTANIWLIHGGHKVDIRLSYGRSPADIRLIYGRYTLDVRLTYAGYMNENLIQVSYYVLDMQSYIHRLSAIPNLPLCPPFEFLSLNERWGVLFGLDSLYYNHGLNVLKEG